MSEQTLEDQREIFERIVEGTDYSEQLTIESEYGELEFEIHPLSRQERWDYMSQMPDGMFQAEEDEDGEVQVSGSSIPDGDATTAFEDLLVDALNHDQFSPSEIQLLVQKFEDEVLFNAAMEVLDRSSEMGDVDGFRITQ